MTNTTTKNKHRKLLICVYTNGARNEFAIGLKEDENFRTMTKVDEFYTRFVDAFDEMGVDEKEIDWKQKLTKWIASAKRNEAIFTELDLRGWNEVGERDLIEPELVHQAVEKVQVIKERMKAAQDHYYSYTNKRR